ncbi:hypothetical protein [Arthrobacter zhaoguopingii]|uniref:hypothetical protein n=1 Tax=Arthrobacter zhaoguopingii TaxID=2681491 RepID=UPI00135BD235|nr:hypothetical protein [Arthrobacter zhaoguopingii]
MGSFAAALELVEAATLPGIEAGIAAGVDRLLAELDAAGLPVLSPRRRAERARIVSVGVPDAGAALRALTDAGISATAHDGRRIRLSPHVTTPVQTFVKAAGILAG